VNVLIGILAVALLAAVIIVVSAPVRAARRRDELASPERGELEAAREAKYREIRDAELDYRTGKLSREDYEAVDGALRAEALEILNRLEAPEDAMFAAERVAQAGEREAGGRSVQAAEAAPDDRGAPAD
jgi:hypothetical protein